MVAHAERGTLMAGTMDSFLIYRLTHRHAIDYSNASRTQLFDIHNLQWDSEICKMFDLPLSMLPHIRYSDSIFGKTTFEGIFDTPILLCGVMGDAHAALFAQRCIHAGMGKISYGDGASVMINTGFHPVLSDDLSVSLAWGMEKKIQYVLEGNVNYAGALLDWMAANLELAPDREHILALAHQVSDSDGVYLIPAFSGLGAPYWNSSVRTQLSGMTLNTRKCHISCAAEQSIAYQVTDVIRAARAVFSGIKTLRADSSLAQDAPLLQFQSDLLRTSITASAMPESPGAGVAFTAGLTVGLYTPEQLENTCSAKRYEPQMRDTQVASLYAGWCNAVSHMLSQPTT